MEVNIAALQYAYLNLVYRLFLNKLLLEIIQSAQTTEATPPEQNNITGERYRYITDGNHTQGERYRYITDDNDTTGERYRYITDDNDTSGERYPASGESTGTTRYTGINVTLYGRGEAVAMNYSASTGSRGGAAYLGKDILGSVRSTSNEYGLLEDRYEYDAFGKPYKGNLINGMNLGYTGKPYDAATGLYNYGYRDYQPVNAGFTTVDPIRDGNNWVAYVNNDPVNWVDPLGLKPGDIFSTIEDAAIDFGTTFNDDSIRNNKEYGASVYYDRVGKGYTYTYPTQGNKDSVWGSVPQQDPVAAQLHTHAAYDPKYDNNNFSSQGTFTDDVKLSNKAGVPSYVATPNGSLLQYDPSTGKTTPVNTNMPSDKNDPTRKNTIDAKSGTTDYSPIYSSGLGQNILDHALNAILGGNKKETLNGGCGY